MNELTDIPIESLRRSPWELRKVLKRSMDYIVLRESIRNRGILTPLLVREIEDWWEIIDGAHRYEIAMDCRIPSIPCLVIQATDEDVLRLQVVMNAGFIETDPVEYARRLWTILKLDRSQSIAELAHSIGKHPDWVRRMLNLVHLSLEAKERLAEGDLCVTTAVELAKLPVPKQDELLALIGTVSATEYREVVQQEARRHREGKKDARLAQKADEDYRYRPFREVKTECQRPIVAASVLSGEGAETLLEAWTAALRWVLRVDKASVAEELRRRKKIEAQEAALLERRIAENLSQNEEPNE